MQTKYISLRRMNVVVLLSTLVLTACGGDAELTGDPTVPKYEDYIEQSLKADTKVNFALLGADKNVPLPNFIFLDREDFTLDIPVSATSSQGINNPIVAMNATDGWSVTSPIVIAFSNDLAQSASVSPSAYRLVETTSPLTGSPTIVKTLQPGNDYLPFTRKNSLIFQPLKPLNPSSFYMFAVSNKLTDAKGNPVGMSSAYAELKSEKQTTVSAIKDLQPAIKLTEGVVSNGAAFTAKEIIYSSWFPTASAGAVLKGAKQAALLTLDAVNNNRDPAALWKGTANPNNISSADLQTLFRIQKPDNITPFLSAPYDDPANLGEGVTVWRGKVNLPYFLETGTSDKAWQKTPWQSATPSLAKVVNAIKEGSKDRNTIISQILSKAEEKNIPLQASDLANIISDETVQKRVLTALFGEVLLKADMSRLDNERLISQYSPLPQLKEIQVVNYLLALPAESICTDNIPVTIFQHGITSKKEVVLALAKEIGTKSCMALLAIDFPLHGQRALADGTIADASNATVFMNLEYLPVGRDNIRQSVADLVSLRIAVGLIGLGNNASDPRIPEPLNKLTFTNGGVNFIGHSLGAMSGIDMVAIANDFDTDNAPEAALSKITKAQFANPGSGIPYLLLGSQSFGPTVKAQIDQGKDSNMSSFDAYSQFAFAAQTVLDTVDPINHIVYATGSLPAYMTIVKQDKVIPYKLNQQSTEIPYSPFGGAKPLTDVINENGSVFSILSATSSIETSNYVALFNKGTHGSLLADTKNANVNTEMQTQMRTFITTDDITVTETSILDTER
ncbi:hypothetical protein [Veronia pacifica]|uniref:Bacterial virulence factor lipase N-terminal domain-containing protein n=1 Tax=Veronia pacifica TaxID=1080227 RepID=A0A1C3EJU8_9GAMM|nr:hypothetical protein [Veronia pacifica]ODA33493.1 hypothetical protein A8L45_09770 [Veronia pacifica]